MERHSLLLDGSIRLCDTLLLVVRHEANHMISSALECRNLQSFHFDQSFLQPVGRLAQVLLVSSFLVEGLTVYHRLGSAESANKEMRRLLMEEDKLISMLGTRESTSMFLNSPICESFCKVSSCPID